VEAPRRSAIALARDGFPVTEALARSLKNVQRSMQKYPASVAAFTKNGVPYEAERDASSSPTSRAPWIASPRRGPPASMKATAVAAGEGDARARRPITREIQN